MDIFSRRRSVKQCHDQCDQIGQFLKVFNNKFSYNTSPNICYNILAFLNASVFKCILPWLHFGQIYDNFGLLHVSASGHTDHDTQGKEKGMLWDTTLSTNSKVYLPLVTANSQLPFLAPPSAKASLGIGMMLCCLTQLATFLEKTLA